MRIDDPVIRERIGLVIKTNRHIYGLTQNELSKRTTLSRVFINEIENGKRIPSMEALLKIAACFGKEATDLIQEAQISDFDERLALALSLKRLVENGSIENLKKLVGFAKTLS